MKRQAVVSVAVFLTLTGIGATYRVLNASDHDDGENDAKSRALNLTDHYVWKDTVDATKINFVQAMNPRSLPGFQYTFSPGGVYEIHVSRIADKTTVPTGADDITYRFAFGDASAAGVQVITFTVLQGTTVVGSDNSAVTTNIADSKAAAAGSGGAVVQTVTIGGVAYKLFAGLREDTFAFDVERFFEVRSFLANAFFGGVAATTPLADFQTKHKTCDGKVFLEGIAGYDTTGGVTSASGSNGDPVHLFNPPSCAADFTKLYNRLEIQMQTTIASLQSSAAETTFDTWSTISILKN